MGAQDMGWMKTKGSGWGEEIQHKQTRHVWTDKSSCPHEPIQALFDSLREQIRELVFVAVSI